jgi:hypothetical protein
MLSRLGDADYTTFFKFSVSEYKVLAVGIFPVVEMTRGETTNKSFEFNLKMFTKRRFSPSRLLIYWALTLSQWRGLLQATTV